MFSPIKSLLLVAGIMLVSAVNAENAVIEQIPPLPPAVRSGEALDPEITILQTEEETVYEYRVNGELFAIKVQPKQGPPYYFYDRNGDGNLEFSRDDPLAGLTVNQWVLWRW